MPARLEELEAALRKLASSNGGGEALQGLEEAIDEVLRKFGGEKDGSVSHDSSALAKHRKAIDASFAGKTKVEDIVSSLEGMVGGSEEEWAKATLKVLHRMSPTALKVRQKSM